MSAWFRGHSGFGLAFLAITALVAGGLGWVTWVALDLERAQRLAQAQADRYERLRLALWRLDAKLFPVLARESSRPFTHYRPLATFSAAIVPPTRTTAITTCDVLHPSPLIEEPLPSWLQLHFQVNPDQVPVLWESPQVPSDGDWACMMQAKFPVTPVPGSEQRRQVLAELKQKLEPNLVRQWLTQQRQQLEAEARPEVRTEMAAADAMGGPAMDNTPWRGQTDNQATRGDASIKSQRIENEFINRAQQRQQLDRGNVYQGQVQGPAPSVPSTVSAQVGPLRPWWLSLVGREDQLLLARWVKVHETEYCQGLLIDDASLRAELADAVADLFPRALLVRLPAGKNDRPEQTLASLPLVLDPNEPLELPEAESWSTLHVGLCLAWLAAVVGLTAVGLGGWSLLDLSERRIRFVSTVTHELRTPLTTLRLYADMLSSGMVTDPKQQQDYMQTLHQEAERLHRLIANVLDYSRLERNRVSVRLVAQPVAEILATAVTTWKVRCRQADKELVVEEPSPADLTAHTDGELVQQILGNLIDNSCKYSQSAADRRVWVRGLAVGKGRTAIEVEDRGPGIPAAAARQVFQAFERGQHVDATTPGVGLGLALAQRWARLLGGQLELLPATEGTGVRFRLSLPSNAAG